MAEAGIENPTTKTEKSRDKTTVSAKSQGDVVPDFVPSGPINHDPQAIELLAIWDRLGDAGRADLMAVAHGLDASAVTK